MALERQQVQIPFAEGVDTKTDSKLVQPNKLLRLENGVFTKLGSIRKRYGYDILPRSTFSGTDIAAATGIARFKDELLLFNGTNLFAFSEASQRWIDKGQSASVKITNKFINQDYEVIDAVGYGYSAGYGVYSWSTASNEVRYSVIDESSGTVIVQDGLVDTSSESPKVVGLGNYVYIFYINGTSLSYKRINIASPQNISSKTDISTEVDPTDKVYELKKYNDRVFIAYNHNAVGGSVRLLYFTISSVLSAEVDLASEEAQTCIGIFTDEANDNVVYSFYDGTDLKYTVYSYDLLTEILPPTTLETVADVRNITGAATSENEYSFIYEIEQLISSTPQNYIKIVTADSTGTVGAATSFVRSVGLASKMYKYNDNYYVLTVHESDLQSTYFLYTLEGSLVSKLVANAAGGYLQNSMLPEVTVIKDDSVFIIPTLKKTSIIQEDGNTFLRPSVNSSRLYMDDTMSFQTVEIANNLHISGGVLQMYDGDELVEHGFNIFPEYITSAITDVGTGSIANGTRQYVVVYAWTDAQGQIHRSAASIPITVTIAGGPSNVELTVPTLRITKKDDAIIEVYRTEDAGTIFYKVTDTTSPVLNSTTTDTLVFEDTVTDAALIDNELLYETGGVLSNIAPPPCAFMTTFKNRLIVKSAEDSNVIWYSKSVEEGKPVEFSDILKVQVDPKGGDVSGLGNMDEKLIIFKPSHIFLLVGDGPNNLGEQNDFGAPQFITSDAGCTDANSIVNFPDGLMFKSKKGIYNLNRGLYPTYIGSPVEDFNELDVVSATLDADSNQVRFITTSSTALIYNYFFGQWSTFTNHAGVGSTIYQNVFTYVKSNGMVYKENREKFTDGSQSIKLKLVTSWIKVAGLQGFQRVYKSLFLGEFKSLHKFRVRIGYNFNTSWTQDITINVGDVIDPQTYGEASPYGSESVYAGNAPLYQWRIFPKKQKCQAIRFEIQDLQDEVIGESYIINALRLEIGVKANSNKLGKSRSYAAT
ncbi:MAG: hypothetical protein FMNOHCHN_03737 [Ignavibacteriaceae bacterium]|nr:hypothetical protein [Ignavibacteriaceae bacterium]